MFCPDSEIFKVEELLEVMVSKGIQPNLIISSTLIDGFSREGHGEDGFNSAVKMFKRMKVMKRMNGREAVSPNATMYGVLLRGLVEKEQFGDALAIHKECLTSKSAPLFEAVKGLIDGLMKESKIDDPKDVVSKMRIVTKGDAVDACLVVHSLA